MSREWSNGIFGCFNDCSTCELAEPFFVVVLGMCSYPPPLFTVGIIAYFCPCYVFGKNAEAVGDSCVLCALSQFVPGLNLWTRISIRGKIREQKGIEVSWQVISALHREFQGVC